jgi:hypothetical protein
MKLNLTPKIDKNIKTGEIPCEDIERVVNAEIDEIEFIIGVPYDNNAEDYFRKRYPVTFALDVYQIQRLAEINFGVAVTDEDIQRLRNFPYDSGFISEVENKVIDWLSIILDKEKENNYYSH